MLITAEMGHFEDFPGEVVSVTTRGSGHGKRRGDAVRQDSPQEFKEGCRTSSPS